MDQDRVRQPSNPVQDKAAYNHYGSHSVASGSPGKLTLALDVRRGLIGASTVAAVVVIAGLTVAFQRGFELRTYDGATMKQKDRDDLLDKWNGYSGNVASALGRPLEMVIAMMTQLLVLRFLSNALLQREPKWHAAAVAVGVSAVLGFLINNGFNALNVQLRDADPTPVIKASDLGASTLATVVNASAVSNITQTFAETQPNNSIANTVLRSAVAPHALKEKSPCDPTPPDWKTSEDIASFGFQQQDWMKYVLPEALNAKKLRVILNATDANANKEVKGVDLPMNASLAADLFVIASMVSRRYIPWGKVGEWRDNVAADALKTWKEGNAMPTGVAAGLLPAKAASSELEQSDFFLRATQSFFNNRTLATPNTSRSNIEVEFAHVDVSPSVTFDSMTWRVELDPATMTELRFTGNNTRYGSASCGPWPGVCSVQRREDDPNMVVHAFSTCANDDGSETLQTVPYSDKTMLEFNVKCPRRSNSSIILLSATRKVVADAILEHMRVDKTMMSYSKGGFVVQNPRKFYSFTVSRLGWTPQDLATKFHATCDSPGGCMGLDVETTNNKRLVAGLDSLPLATLSPIAFDLSTNSKALTAYRVLTVIEPPLNVTNTLLARDYLLAHNVGSNDMSRQRESGIECATYDDERAQLVLNNHLYMESTLQTTYTAGVFFLFQSAVVREKAMLTKLDAETLAFDGNVLNLSLWISIPAWNALLTGAGCVLLLVGFLSAMIWSRSARSDALDSMDAITTPHVIARVMLDENAFPPSVVHRRVVNDPAGTVVAGDKTAASLVDAFYIESLTIQPRDEAQGRAAGFV